MDKEEQEVMDKLHKVHLAWTSHEFRCGSIHLGPFAEDLLYISHYFEKTWDENSALRKEIAELRCVNKGTKCRKVGEL